uniref:Putative secreted protein n=1 Tax=Ixodes ricinus TaxID=34613 RepID=A0A6B0U0L2_IXORI
MLRAALAFPVGRALAVHLVRRVLLVVHGRLVWHQHRWRPEHVAERVVHEVHECVTVDVGVATDLVSKEGLPRTAAEHAAQDPIAHVELM